MITSLTAIAIALAAAPAAARAPDTNAYEPTANAQAVRAVRFATAPAAGGTLVLLVKGSGDSEAMAALDPATRASVERAIAAAAFKGGARATLSLRGIGAYDQIILIGRGDTPNAVALGEQIGKAIGTKAGAVSIRAAGLGADEAAALASGLATGAYQPALYRANGTDAAAPGPVTIVTRDARASEAAWQGRWRAVGDAVGFARSLTNEPANVIYPESFVARTRAALAGVQGVTIEVFDVPAMERLGMGALLSVGKGSIRPPRLLVVRYRGAATGAPVVLAGKGITFDSGGISIKPSAGMGDMKMDMAGAAAVTGAVVALAKGRAPVDVVAIAALAENMPGHAASRPGDVVRAMNGKTIEIISTDAEGRMVLSDALAWAQATLKPAAIVDVATLTGAIGTALGNDYAGLFSRHDGLARQIEAAGTATNESVWRMPLHESTAEDVKSPIADLRNGGGGGGGASFGAWFIGEFVDRATPWAHLDIASVAWGQPTDTHPGGATGWGVRLLERFVRDHAANAR